MRRRGFVLLEVLCCAMVVLLILGGLFAAILGLQRQLKQQVIDEERQETFAALTAVIRDDLRRATKAEWIATPAGQALRLGLPDQSIIEYAVAERMQSTTVPLLTRSQGFFLTRRVLLKEKAAGYAEYRGFKTLSLAYADSETGGFWETKPLADGAALELGAKPVFLVLTLDFDTATRGQQRLTVGAATRCALEVASR